MANAPNASRQRHHRHHRGTAQRRIDSDDSSRRQPGTRLPKESTSLKRNSLPAAAADIQDTRDDLLRILGQAKELNASRSRELGEIQEFSQTVQQKLAQACLSLSTEATEDVDLMAKVVFFLFNSDLVKVSTISLPHLNPVEALCKFFISAFDYETTQRTTQSETATDDSDTIDSLADTAGRLKVDIMRAMSAALFENGSYVKDSLQDIFRVIITAVNTTQRQDQPELRRMALNCMANLVHKTGSLYSSLHERMYEILLSNLTSTSQYESDTLSGPPSAARRRDRGSERKLISSALRALHFLMQEDKSIATRSMAPLMGVICRFMFFTSESWNNHAISSTVPSTLSVRVIQPSSYASHLTTASFNKPRGASGNIAPLLDNSESSYISYRNIQSSDSEYSDSETGVHQAQRRQHDGKVRLNALMCLQALARAAPKQLQPHWPKFLTSSTSAPMTASSHKAPSLITLVGSDPISNVRSAACVVLGNILESSKQYLAMAEESTVQSGTKSQTGLLALSERVGVVTRELHEGMATAMNGVDNSVDQSIVVQMIKCCSSIVANCNYDKMRPGLCLLLFKSTEKFLDSGEPLLQAGTLFFLTALLSNTSAQTDLKENVLLRSATSNDETSVFLSRLLEFVENLQVSTVVRLEAWSTLQAIAQFYFDVIQTIWPRLDAALGSGANTDDIRLRSAGLLFLEEYCKSGTTASCPSSAEWWQDVMEKHILKAFSEENPSIKALGCDCISHLSSDAFNGLSNRLEMSIMSLVLGTALDENAVARAAACRTIGMFILFPSLREDSTHILDMATTVLDLCQDTNMNVRVRASWAVGNLCDALVLLKTKGLEHVLDEVLTLALWTKIMKTALLICQDHEKLKSNGIRAIGGLLRVTFEGILERERHSLVKDAIYTLIKHMEQGSLKGRWNACYAMQNVLLNPDFPIGSTAGTSYALDSDMVSWTRDVYDALLQAIRQSRNFKVRINACAALTMPKTRAKYGDQAMMRKMVQVLMAEMQSLDADQGDHEFGEFQYRGQLETKILRCLDHLLQLTGGVASLELELDPVLRQRIVASRPEVTTT
ncbi:HEAT repeat-containing protein 6 [Dissophora globulifera]|nr:HEAT repeat-containing protein 6 [Dissophora globulifera]